MGTDPRHLAGVAWVMAGIAANSRQRIIKHLQMVKRKWRGWRGFVRRVAGGRGFQGCEPEFSFMAIRGAITPAIPANRGANH